MINSFSVAVLHTITISCAVAQLQGQSDCVTPNRAPGLCIGIRNCPQLLNALQARPLQPKVVDFLRESQCGFEGSDPRVCCPFQSGGGDGYENRDGGTDSFNPFFQQQDFGGNNGNANNANLQYDLSNNPLLPTDCGKDLSQRIVGGERTELDEFPWMALLEYVRPTGKSLSCGGVLISRRYVLTAAHCIKGKDMPSTWRLESVRLGEYDTSSDRDCIQDGEDSVICADDPVTIGIEEQITHENYRPTARDQRYDIALLRLARDVVFTNYIKPICLPPSSVIGKKVFVAGWGKTENGSSSNVKLKLGLPLSDAEQCQSTYGSAGLTLGYGQFCAGGQKGKDSCRGDSGGPLMSVDRDRDGNGKWTAVGIVSFGPSPCGMAGWPGVYTRVADFVPWILSKMRLFQPQDPAVFHVVDLPIRTGSEKNPRTILYRTQMHILDQTIRSSKYTDMIQRIVLFGLLFLSGTSSAQDSCIIPDNKLGVCINIHNCQPVLDILRQQQPLSRETLAYLHGLQCGFEGKDPKVCCEQRQTPPVAVTKDPAPPDVTNHRNVHLVNRDDCGPVTQSKILGGNQTSVIEFPWMALLAYDLGNPLPEFRCGGSLINKRYVLTAAHCVTSLPSNLRLIGVRLGDHDLASERDCDRYPNGTEVICAAPYQDFEIESTHPHPEYSRGKLKNDIALIRLSRDADIGPSNVRPICLPIGTAVTPTQTKVRVTGWGATEKGTRSLKLLQVSLSPVSLEECAETYKSKVQIWYKQMCAGGKSGKDSCQGDSGGPLQAPSVYNNNPIYVQYGLVSFGPQNCGTEGAPGVYTRILYYMDWILDTIRS
ncbi:uncharacterized protein LOC108630945 [Ceratina calcarata]|uniref:Uncharacterized protein LOC108630945 n=1 Tax=Ceratina calcarata TaxID=156304 RepID=A0AAJ7NDL8_9HYME|nr:uncharacterized protein LOC108630945 [Ceratina calcarata]